MTDPRYPGSGPPYGGYPPPDPYGQPQQYAPPQQYGQPQQYGNGYGAPPQYGNAYGTPTQYGSPYAAPGQYGSPFDQPSPFGTPPPKKSSGLKVAGILIGALVLVAALAIGGLYIIGSKAKNNDTANAAGPAASAGSSHGATPSSAAPQPKTTDPTNAKIGDCLAGETMDSNTAKEVTDIRIVSCTAADAKYKVVGIVTGKTEVQFDTDDNICSAYPSAVSELWQGRTGEVGSVLCLAATKK